MTLRDDLVVVFEDHLRTGDAPRRVEPGVPVEGTIDVAVEASGNWHDPHAALECLRGVLSLPLEPDPLAEQLLQSGSRLARQLGNDRLHEQFESRLRRYQSRYAATHALARISETLTEYALAAAEPLPPLAADERPADGPPLVTLLRLLDAASARFESARAHLHDISEPGLDYHEIVVEAAEADAGFLVPVDPRQLVLRLIFDERVTEISTGDGSLFDAELNLEERRLYLKLRGDRYPWSELDSVVFMDGRIP